MFSIELIWENQEDGLPNLHIVRLRIATDLMGSKHYGTVQSYSFPPLDCTVNSPIVARPRACYAANSKEIL